MAKLSIPRLFRRQSKEDRFNLKNPKDWVKFFQTHLSKSGANVTGESSLKSSAVYACVDSICGDVSTLERNVIEETDKGKTVNTDHPVYKLINNPNPWMRGSTFWYNFMLFHLNWGNGLAWIRRDKNLKPTSLVLLHPGYAFPAFGNEELFIKYQGPLFGQHQANMILHYDDVIHYPNMALDGVWGRSIIQYARESIGEQISATELSATMFANKMFLGAYVSMNEFLKKEQREAIEESLSNFQGTVNSWKTPVLDGGAKMIPWSQPLADAQFIENREHGVKDVARYYKVPLYKIAGSDPTFSNIENQKIEYVEGTVRPKTFGLDEELTYKLFNFGEERFSVNHELKTLLKGDIDTRTEFYHKMWDRGIFSINDILRQENLPTIGPDGDIRMVPMNYVPLDRVNEWISRLIEKAKNELAQKNGVDLRGFDIIEELLNK